MGQLCFHGQLSGIVYSCVLCFRKVEKWPHPIRRRLAALDWYRFGAAVTATSAGHGFLVVDVVVTFFVRPQIVGLVLLVVRELIGYRVENLGKTAPKLQAPEPHE